MGAEVERLLESFMVSFALLSAPEAASPQTPLATREQRFFEWTRMPHSKEVYRARREKMLTQLRRSGGGVHLTPSRHGVSEGFTFRQLDDFLYLTGLELPDSMLVLDADAGSVVLFTPPRDSRYESEARPNDFPGRLLETDPDLRETSGIADVRAFSELSAAVAGWVSKGKRLRLNFGRPGSIQSVESDFIARWTAPEALAFHLRREYPDGRVDNAYEDVARLRMVHGPEEIDAMRRVCALTADAIRNTAAFVRDGIDERTLEAELEAEFKRGGSQRLAFASIIKSGPNSLWPWRILAANYDRRNRVLREGELVIFDVGTELDYYVSDVGRTFPVSGRFTAEQKERLEMVTAVSDAVLAAIRPGVTFADLKQVALANIPEKERAYMQAGGFFGHHIGLSSGDPALPEAPLEAGMIFTVEPWYYNHEEELAVFIEDVVLVTADGHENLTASLPRTAEALELVTGKQAGNR